MRILLDTCTFLWVVAGSNELSSSSRDLFASPRNEIYLSSASAWEIIIKNRLGKLPLPTPPDVFINNQRISHKISTLSITESAVLQLSKLPDFHQDPFDRLLICQAIEEGLTILTPDRHIKQYAVSTVW